MIPALQALHTHPKYWGEDSLTWEPRRWILSSTPPLPATADLHKKLARERLLEPEKGRFIAWSEGTRNCPGKRFAQVEFVAVMARLFRDHVAEPVPRDDETASETLDRVMRVVKDSSVGLLLEMQDAKSVTVRWRQR